MALRLELSEDEARVLRDTLGDVPVTATWQRRVVAEDLLGRLNRLLAPHHPRSARRPDRIQDRSPARG